MLCKNAPLAVWGTKMGILRGLGLPIEQAEEIAAGYLEVVEQSEDHAEGPRSFVEKRKPAVEGALKRESDHREHRGHRGDVRSPL